MKKQIVAAALLAGASSLASALPIINGSFETGDLTGWNFTNLNGGSASVVTTDAGFSAVDGTYFANLTATGLISQAQSWNQGDILSFAWNFNANDYLPYNDYSLFQVKDAGGAVIDSVTLANVAATGDYNATGWNTYNYMFTNTGTGALSFGVYNVLDTNLDSQLYLDAVKVPEPSSLALLGLGLAGLGFSRRRRTQ